MAHRTLLILWCFFCSTVCVIAQERPKIQVAIEPEEIYAGETFTLQVLVQNIDSPAPPDLSALDENFRYEFQGSQPMSSSSTIIINGRVIKEEEFKTIFQYKLTPKSTGRLIIPPISLRHDGQEIKSASKSILVVEPEPQEFVIANVFSSKASVYPTESFDVTLQILVRALPDNERRDPLTPLNRNPPALTIPWIDVPEGLKGPDNLAKWLGTLASDRDFGFTINRYQTDNPFDFAFGGRRFALFDLVRGVETRELQDGTKAKFFRYEFTMRFLATRSGTYQFGPAMVRGSFVIDTDRRDYKAKKIVVTTEPCEVLVKDVPANRPEGFLGGVGQFRASLSATPTRVRVGDPMTLTLDITSDTIEALEMVSAPDLRKIESIARDFEIIDHAPVGRTEGRNKVFTYGIRPKAKREEIPALTLYGFDPSKEQFFEINTRSVPLEIQDGATLEASELVGTAAEKRSSLKTDRSGIYQGTLGMYPIVNEEASIVVWAGAAGLSWLLALGGVLVLRLRSRPSSLTAMQRVSQAKSQARERLAQARRHAKEGKGSEARVEVRRSIVGLLAAEMGCSSEGLTTQNVIQQLDALELADEHRSHLRSLLDELDASHYGGSGNQDLQSMLDRAQSLIEPLSHALRRASKGSNRKILSGCLGLFLASVAHGHALANENLESTVAVVSEALERAATPEDFVAVAEQLDDLASRGLTSGALHFHAGNAWFRAKSYGKAIRHYRIARFYMPRDAYLQSNLDQALAMAPGQLPGSSESKLIDKILFWSDWLAYPNKIRLGTLAITGGAILFFLAAWFKSRKLLIGTGALCLVGAFLLVDAWLNSPHQYVAHHGVIFEETIARKGMGTEYAPAFDRPVLEGAEFEILQRTSGWTLARFPGVGDGWVKNSTVSP